MTPLEILLAGRSRLSAPESWCQGAEAKNAAGRPVLAKDPTAVCFCMMAAIDMPESGTCSLEADRAFGFLARVIGGPVTKFNDAKTTKHADVVAVFDRAIEIARGGA